MADERSKVAENLTASLILVVVCAAALGLAWIIKMRGVPPTEPKHACPYCGKTIIVRLEPNGEEKKP